MRSISSSTPRSASARAVGSHGVGPGVGHRGIAGDPAGELRALFQRQCLEALFDALVLVAQALLQPQDLLADDRETEMPGFDRTRVHRPDRNLVHAFAFDRDEGVAVFAWLRGPRRIEVLAQRERAFGPGAVPQPLAVVGLRRRNEAQQVGGRALHAVRRWVDIGDAGIGRRLVRQGNIDPQQTRREREREVQRITAAAPGLVAAP